MTEDSQTCLLASVFWPLASDLELAMGLEPATP